MEELKTSHQYLEREYHLVDAAVATGNWFQVKHVLCNLIRKVLRDFEGDSFQQTIRTIRKRWGHIIDIDRYLENIEEREHSGPCSAVMFDENSYSAEIDVANKVGDEFATLSVLVDPCHKDDLAWIVQSRCLGYGSLDSIVRHAIARHLEWTFGMRFISVRSRDHYRPSVQLAKRMQFERHFYIALDVLQPLVNLGKYPVGGLAEVRNSIRRFRSTYWKKHYLYQFDKRFQNLLRK